MNKYRPADASMCLGIRVRVQRQSTTISRLHLFRQLMMTPAMSYMVDEKVEKMTEW